MRRMTLFLAAWWLAGPSVAAPTPAPSAHYLAVDTINLSALLPAPPADDSIVTHAELEVLYHLQTELTPAQIARARLVDAEDLFSFGSDVLGPWFDTKNLPRTAAFFAQIGEDLTPISRAAKGLYPRRRPPFLDARLKPCIEFSDTPSYPSGHGLRSALWAGLLTALFPDQAAGFARRAAESRWGRLLAGVHCPSDCEAGRILGEALAQKLLQSPGAQKALEEVRAEIAPFLLKKAG